MARRQDNVEEEDVLDDGHIVQDDEDEGEDLMGENMAADYASRPELDEYDPEILDENDQTVLTVRQRQEAERLMTERDVRAGRMQLSPSGSTDVEGSPPQQKKRRMMNSPGTVSAGDPSPDDDDDDEDAHESMYDLSMESIDDKDIDKRLRRKIQKCFQQFLLKYAPDGSPRDPIYPDKIKKMAEENQLHLDVSWKDLNEWSGKLALWVAEHPVHILPLLEATLMEEAQRKYATYQQMEDDSLCVAIHSFPMKEPLRELCNTHVNKLILVHGVVTKRTGVLNQVKMLHLRCAKCNFPSGPFIVAEDKDLRPGACVECQSRGPWAVDRQRTVYRNHQKITLQESPGSVEAGKMPRSKEVILTGDQVDSVRPGDELHLTGTYKCLYDAATNARTCFPVYKTIIEAIHLHRHGDIKVEKVTDDEEAKILDLAKQKNIRERFIASMAPSIYGMKYVKTAVAMSLMGGVPKVAAGKHRIRGDLNALIVGDPGMAKSQFLKYVEGIFPRAVYTTGKGASAVGLTAAVQRDEHGDFALQGGAMVLADDGICLIDEFDKMNDKDRTSIHEAMEQQTISISKAGIVATLQARCAVIAVGNPQEGRYDPQRTFAQNVNLSDPILSRFDMLCVIRDESDPLQDERLADHVVCSHIRSHPEADADDRQIKPKLQMKATSHFEPIDQELLRKYIIYARQHCRPTVSDLDKEKLATFYKEIRQTAHGSGGSPMTARHIESIIRLAEANAKIELRKHVLAKDLDHALGMMLESFIQTQKHQVAEELRRSFRKYIAHATPIFDQFMRLLEKMFRAKAEEMRLIGKDASAAEIAVPMTEVAFAIGKEDLDLHEAETFMQSDRFREHFRSEGENLYQIV